MLSSICIMWTGKPEPLFRTMPRQDGGARRDRTADLLHAMQALSQLSYGPLPFLSHLQVTEAAGRLPCRLRMGMVPQEGFEPPTPSLRMRCSTS